MDTSALEIILAQCDTVGDTTQRRAFAVFARGGGRYTVTEATYYTHEPPKVYEFETGIGDVIVIWSTNPFLRESTAHEIAVQVGERFGWYV